MTTNEFQELRQQAEDFLNKKLALAKVFHHKGLLHKDYYDKRVLIADYRTGRFTIPAHTIDLPKVTKQMLAFNRPTLIDSKILFHGYTKQIGRTDYFEYAKVEEIGYRLVSKITQDHVTNLVRDILTSRYGVTPDCRLMKQFANGNLTFEQVLDGSKDESC